MQGGGAEEMGERVAPFFIQKSLAGKRKGEQDGSWRAQQDPAKVFARGKAGAVRVWNTSDFKARLCLQMCSGQ